MPVVRYVALAALVVWLGGTMQRLSGELGRHVSAIAYSCGCVMLVALLIMKFVGPPPRAFFVRIALVAVMLIATAVAQLNRASTAPEAVTAVAGLVLLSFYARE
jgi:hypothetical protein